MGDSIAMKANGYVSNVDPSEKRGSWDQLPLPFFKNGQTGHIVKVRGKEELLRHLETMGFVAGASIKVVSQVAGNVIVEVKGTQVALSQQVATHIIASL